MTTEELKERIKGLAPKEAIEILDAHILQHPDDEEALTLRGIKHWSSGNRALAIKDYLAAIRINPESNARQALDAANEILDYRNKDLYNP